MRADCGARVALTHPVGRPPPSLAQLLRVKAVIARPRRQAQPPKFGAKHARLALFFGCVPERAAVRARSAGRGGRRAQYGRRPCESRAAASPRARRGARQRAQSSAGTRVGCGARPVAAKARLASLRSAACPRGVALRLCGPQPVTPHSPYLSATRSRAGPCPTWARSWTRGRGPPPRRPQRPRGLRCRRGSRLQRE